MRNYINNTTSYYPLGSFSFHSIDMKALFDAKANKKSEYDIEDDEWYAFHLPAELLWRDFQLVRELTTQDTSEMVRNTPASCVYPAGADFLPRWRGFICNALSHNS